MLTRNAIIGHAALGLAALAAAGHPKAQHEPGERQPGTKPLRIQRPAAKLHQKSQSLKAMLRSAKRRP